MDSMAEKRRHRFKTTKLIRNPLGADRTQVTVEKFRRDCGNLPILASLARHLVRQTAIDCNAVRMAYRQQPSTDARPSSKIRPPRYARVVKVGRSGGRVGQAWMP